MEKYHHNKNCNDGITDHGLEPYAADIETLTRRNGCYRTALWTGDHLQVTLMSIPAGGDVGLEVHPYTDQLLRVEEGYGLAEMGADRDELTYRQKLRPGHMVFVPAGVWHNVTNTGRGSLKLYSVYGPAHHPVGMVEAVKASK